MTVLEAQFSSIAVPTGKLHKKVIKGIYCKCKPFLNALSRTPCVFYLLLVVRRHMITCHAPSLFTLANTFEILEHLARLLLITFVTSDDMVVWKSLSNKLIHVQLKLIMKSNLETHTQRGMAWQKKKKNHIIDINDSSALINQSLKI